MAGTPWRDSQNGTNSFNEGALPHERLSRRGDWPPPRVGVRLLVDLDVAADQPAWPVRVGRRFDTEGVRRPGLAAVVDVHGIALRGGDCRPDHRGYAGERGVLASRCRRAGRAGTADKQSVHGLGLYPYLRLVIVVLKVP